MKKQRLIIVLVIIFAVAVVLCAPFRITKYDDGGTREYSALTYKIVVWNRFNDVVDAGIIRKAQGSLCIFVSR